MANKATINTKNLLMSNSIRSTNIGICVEIFVKRATSGELGGIWET